MPGFITGDRRTLDFGALATGTSWKGVALYQDKRMTQHQQPHLLRQQPDL